MVSFRAATAEQRMMLTPHPACAHSPPQSLRARSGQAYRKRSIAQMSESLKLGSGRVVLNDCKESFPPISFPHRERWLTGPEAEKA